VVVEETHRFLAPLLSGCRRVLEVGCGNGLLARRLAADGFEVTAVDRSLAGTERAAPVRFVEADFLGFEDAPFDALVFSASLHHLFPLERALENAGRLLRPGGLLAAADFDLDAPDRETLRWLYDLQGLLGAAGLLRREVAHGSDEDDPLARWEAEHAGDPPLHRGCAMRAALAGRFELLGTARGPYLHRSIAGQLEPSRHAARIARWVLTAELHRIAAGTLRPVGLRLWARTARAEPEKK
jgi:SAM-dependent methyltransferase